MNQHLKVIFAVPNVDPKNPHPGFYPKEDLLRPGQATFEMDFSRAAHNSIHNIYVVLLDDSGYHELTQNMGADGQVLKLPPGTSRVSNLAPVKRF
ncbi:hypothetical protein ACFWBX_20280 [Streptomyces sp. NPDC059991]|uniref:hypothetical protein n=1 Tax=Streptomyces sp. NPDC059991 TaxID=3347028 RepID=UPI0036AC82D8